MDPITQIAIGAAVAVAISPKEQTRLATALCARDSTTLPKTDQTSGMPAKKPLAGWRGLEKGTGF